MAADNNDKETLEKRVADDAEVDCEAGINSSNNDEEVIAVDKDDDDNSVDKDTNSTRR